MSSESFLQITPTELVFKFELRKNIPVSMQLTNPTGERVAFKVKTTSPKKYCVRPSSGFIDPRSNKEVQVIMQAQREAPVSYSDCRDKFLVQAIKVPASVKEITPDVFDPSKAAEIKHTKLRVVLEPPAKPPSPVPEGNESEISSPPGTFRPLNFTDADKDKAAQVNSRINSLIQSTQVATPQPRSAVRQSSAPSAGFGLISLLLVALLAFVIGHYTQTALPELSKLAPELNKIFENVIKSIGDLKSKYF